jgi:hypothetical protein
MESVCELTEIAGSVGEGSGWKSFLMGRRETVFGGNSRTLEKEVGMSPTFN